jgi:hypothetical protein
MRIGMVRREGDGPPIRCNRLFQLALHDMGCAARHPQVCSGRRQRGLRFLQQRVQGGAAEAALLCAGQHQLCFARMAGGQKRAGIGQPVLPDAGL